MPHLKHWNSATFDGQIDIFVLVLWTPCEINRKKFDFLTSYRNYQGYLGIFVNFFWIVRLSYLSDEFSNLTAVDREPDVMRNLGDAIHQSTNSPMWLWYCIADLFLHFFFNFQRNICLCVYWLSLTGSLSIIGFARVINCCYHGWHVALIFLRLRRRWSLWRRRCVYLFWHQYD